MGELIVVTGPPGVGRAFAASRVEATPAGKAVLEATCSSTADTGGLAAVRPQVGEAR
jgi:hypothetical protein